jgi:5-hydroxyisourate hydrolase-like protein (transthyretin family)
MRIHIAAFIPLLLLTFLSACSNRPKLERPDDLPKLFPCSVIATFGGQPLEGVSITLIPTDDSKWKPTGTTDKNGKTELSASFGFKGAPAGQYKVSFRCVEVNPDYDEKQPNSKRFRSSIPLKYEAKTSKETAEVKAGENELTFALDAGSELTN